MEYQFITIPASKMASAAFFWSLLHYGMEWVRFLSEIQKLIHFQNDRLVFHTSYKQSELVDLVLELNDLVKLAPQRKNIMAIYEKYYEVNLQNLT